MYTGVHSCRVCLGHSSSQEGAFDEKPCSECENALQKEGETATISKDFACKLQELPHFCVIALETIDRRFGFLIFRVDQAGLFELYKPFVINLGNLVALSLENRLQKNDLQQARDVLERRVAERTEQLGSANRRLKEDITERERAEEALRRLNRELRAISNCNQVLMRAENEQTLLNDICRIVHDEAGYRMAWVGYADNDEAKTIRPVAWAGVEDGYLATANITWADAERGRGPGGTAIRSGETVYVQDFTTDPRMAPWREDALQRGYRSTIALPLKDESAKAFGVLLIYSMEISAFTPDELRLLEELAGDLAFGINVLRTRSKRKAAEETVGRLNADLSATLQAIPDLLFELDQTAHMSTYGRGIRPPCTGKRSPAWPYRLRYARAGCRANRHGVDSRG